MLNRGDAERQREYELMKDLKHEVTWDQGDVAAPLRSRSEVAGSS